MQDAWDGAIIGQQQAGNLSERSPQVVAVSNDGRHVAVGLYRRKNDAWPASGQVAIVLSSMTGQVSLRL